MTFFTWDYREESEMQQIICTNFNVFWVLKAVKCVIQMCVQQCMGLSWSEAKYNFWPSAIISASSILTPSSDSMNEPEHLSCSFDNLMRSSMLFGTQSITPSIFVTLESHGWKGYTMHLLWWKWTVKNFQSRFKAIRPIIELETWSTL